MRRTRHVTLPSSNTASTGDTILVPWANSLFSSTDPAERLSELVDDRREAFGDIRLVLDRLSAKYHFKPREIDAAMGQVDDVLGDLFYETRIELEEEIDQRVRERDE